VAKKMKLKVVVELDVDREAWAEEYGIDPRFVWEDVRAYLANVLQVGTLPGELGLWNVEATEVSVRR
jgi:hypothetical protein